MALFGEIEQPKKIQIVCEKQVVMEVDSVLKGLLAVIALYYTCHYCYCPHVSKTLQFLQRYWAKIMVPKVPDSVKELTLYMGIKSL